MNIKDYINVAVAREGFEGSEAASLRRTLSSDFSVASVAVTADLNDQYKSEIDRLVKRMKAKRTPLEERVPVPYTAKVGDHDKALAASKDPLSGEPLTVVVLAKKRRALYNPNNGVVYPIPVQGKA